MKDVLNSNGKNVRIELLRVVAMLMILMLHYFNQGKVLSLTSSGTVGYYLVWTIEGICFVAVNIYMFVSGYFLSVKNFSWRRVVSFYATILFYSLVLFAVFFITNGDEIEFKTVLSIFPIICGRGNWYVTVYFVVLLISPILNLVAMKLDKVIYRRMIIILFIVFSVLPTVFFWIDQFDLHDGYSILWYSYLYLVAAYIRKYGVKIKNGILYLMLISIVLLPISRFAVDYVMSIVNNSMLSGLQSALFCYNSFPVFLSSFSIFVLVIKSGTKEKKNWKDSVILFLGKTSFAVFYIHSFVLIRNKIWLVMGSERYIDSVFQVLHGIVCILIVYIVCSIVEEIRLLLFKYVRIDSLINKMYVKLDETICLCDQKK